jgi:hypothetical protein
MFKRIRMSIKLFLSNLETNEEKAIIESWTAFSELNI